jgi:hypothetical protein
MFFSFSFGLMVQSCGLRFCKVGWIERVCDAVSGVWYVGVWKKEAMTAPQPSIWACRRDGKCRPS